jgi:hypothetical protein
MLDQDFDVVQACLDQVLREDWEAALPGADLGGSGAPSGVVAHLLGDPRGQCSIQRQLGKADGRVAKQRHG